MKTMLKKTAVSALAVCLICACMPVFVHALPVNCGGNITWRHDAETNAFVFYGDGAMDDFEPDLDHTEETFPRVVIEEGVTYVGAYLFDSDHIGELILPDKLSVSENAFYGCTIDRVVFPQTAADVTQYDFGDENVPFGNATVCSLDLGGLNGFPSGFRFTFGDNYDLKSLIVGANTTVIPDYACNCFGALESLTLPDGLTTIGCNAFESCEMLQAVVIPDSVTTIGDYAFDYCTSMETLTLPMQLQTIGEWAFCCCENLTSIEIPLHTTTIGISAFEGCSNLSKVTIPDSVKSIGINAFAQTALRNVHLPAGLQYIHASSFGSTLEYVCCDTEDCPAVKQFAENTEIEFRLCDGHAEQVLVAGDANGDGILNLKDTVLIRRYLAGGWDVTIDETAADVDGDNKVTVQDVVLLNRYIAGGWDVELA